MAASFATIRFLRLLFRLCSPFPQLDGPIPGSAGEAFAVGREGNASHSTAMALQSPEVPAGGQIPKLDRVIVAGADQHFPIRGNSETADPILVAGEGFLLDGVRHLEELDGGISAAGNQQFGVRGEGHGPDPVIHRFLESAVILDIVAASLRGI